MNVWLRALAGIGAGLICLALMGAVLGALIWSIERFGHPFYGMAAIILTGFVALAVIDPERKLRGDE